MVCRCLCSLLPCVGHQGKNRLTCVWGETGSLLLFPRCLSSVSIDFFLKHSFPSSDWPLSYYTCTFYTSLSKNEK